MDGPFGINFLLKYSTFNGIFGILSFNATIGQRWNMLKYDDDHRRKPQDVPLSAAVLSLV